MNSFRIEVSRSILAKAAVYPLSMLTVSIIFRSLPVEQYAIYSFFVAFCFQIGLFDLGQNAAIKTSISKSLARSGEEELRKYTWTGICIVASAMTTVFVIFISVNLIPGSHFSNKYLVEIGSEPFLYSCGLLFFLLSIVLGHSLHASSGLGRSEFLAYSQTINAVILFFLSSGLLLTDTLNQVNLFVVFCVSNLLAQLFIISKYWKVIKSLLIPKNFPSITVAKEMLQLGAYLFVLQQVLSAQIFIPRLVVAGYFEPSDLALYDVILRLFSPLIVISMALSVPLWTRIAFAKQNNNFESIGMLIANQKLAIVGLTIVLIVLSIFSAQIILFWLGKDAPLPSGLTIVAFASMFLAHIFYLTIAAICNGLGLLKLQGFLGFLGVFLSCTLFFLFVTFDRLDLTRVFFITASGLSVFGVLGVAFIAKEIGRLNYENE